MADSITPDLTVGTRKFLAVVINSHPHTKEQLQEKHGQAWTSDELREHFEVIGFASPLVVVKRKADGQKGSLYFQAAPRIYFGWAPDYSHN